MTVFYSNYMGGCRIDFIRWLGDAICDADISYWIVPGTLNLNED